MSDEETCDHAWLDRHELDDHVCQDCGAVGSGLSPFFWTDPSS